MNVELHPTHTALQCRRTRTALAHHIDDHNVSDTVVAEEEGKAFREGRPAGWGGWPGGVAGLVGWRAGSGGGQGLVAGLFWCQAWWGRLAWWDCWPGGQRGKIFRVKNVLE